MEPLSPAAAPKRKLRWYQYSLRTLLILVTLFAVACSWFAVKMNQAKRQRETVEAIEKLGGFAICAYSFDNAEPKVMTTHYAPAWLRKLLGDDFFDTVSQLDLRYCNDPDSALTMLRELPQVRHIDAVNSSLSDVGLEKIGEQTPIVYLNLAGTKITDAGVARLKNLKQLQWLCLEKTGVADKSLKTIEGFSRLEKLFMSGTHVTDAGMERLEGLRKLRVLDLGGTQITDDGLKFIADLPELRDLYLHDTKLTDAGMERLGGLLPRLKVLWVSGTSMTDASLDKLGKLKNIEYLGVGSHVTDDGLEKLSGMTQLIDLDLSGSRVTDAGLEYLKSMQKLRYLSTGGTKITTEGAKNLQKSVPTFKRM